MVRRKMIRVRITKAEVRNIRRTILKSARWRGQVAVAAVVVVPVTGIVRREGITTTNVIIIRIATINIENVTIRIVALIEIVGINIIGNVIGAGTINIKKIERGDPGREVVRQQGKSIGDVRGRPKEIINKGI